jgi:hypothetical protein
MTPEQWGRIMRRAREYAANHGGRARVVGYRLPPRAARYIGTNWGYVLTCPDTCWCRADRRAS